MARAALGLRLRDMRKAAGLTQQQLAAATYTSRSSVACIETGRQNAERGFWRRADEATGAVGVLVAGYENLQTLARRLALCGSTTLGAAGSRDVPGAGNGSISPASGGGVELDFRTVPGTCRTGGMQAAGLLLRDVPGRSRPNCRGRGIAGPGVAASGLAVLPGERSQELFVRAHALLAENDRRDVEAAKALLDRAVMRDPGFAQAIAARGYASWRQYFAGWAKHSQALANAMSDIKAALAADPDSVWAHLTFIRVCWDMGWHEPRCPPGSSCTAITRTAWTPRWRSRAR